MSESGRSMSLIKQGDEIFNEIETAWLFGPSKILPESNFTLAEKTWCTGCMGPPPQLDLTHKVVLFDLDVSRECYACRIDVWVDWVENHGGAGVIRTVKGQAGHGLVSLIGGPDEVHNRKSKTIPCVEASLDERLEGVIAAMKGHTPLSVIVVPAANPWESVNTTFMRVVLTAFFVAMHGSLMVISAKKFVAFWRKQHNSSKKKKNQASSYFSTENIPLLVCGGIFFTSMLRTLYGLDTMGWGYIYGDAVQKTLLTFDLPWRFATTILVGLFLNQVGAGLKTTNALTSERITFLVSIGVVMVVFDGCFTALRFVVPTLFYQVWVVMLNGLIVAGEQLACGIYFVRSARKVLTQLGSSVSPVAMLKGSASSAGSGNQDAKKIAAFRRLNRSILPVLPPAANSSSLEIRSAEALVVCRFSGIAMIALPPVMFIFTAVRLYAIPRLISIFVLMVIVFLVSYFQLLAFKPPSGSNKASQRGNDEATTKVSTAAFSSNVSSEALSDNISGRSTALSDSECATNSRSTLTSSESS